MYTNWKIPIFHAFHPRDLENKVTVTKDWNEENNIWFSILQHRNTVATE